MEPIRIGIIGTGGFAAEHHAALQALEAAGEFRLIATCDPNPSLIAAAAERWNLEERGVRRYADYRAMLEAEAGALEVVTVPTPIPLHAEMHRACVERHLACYLEKPPTLDYVELDTMLAVEADARRATQVGFNFIVEAPRQALKARIIAGEFGAVRRVGFTGLWPRPTTYYQRNNWAGRLRQGDRMVLDSCIGNAMAHYIHNVHFWAGQEGLFSWATAARVEAELYRARAIEGFDTCFVRAVCDNGIALHIAASHACDGASGQQEWVECEQATITYITHKHYSIAWRDGRTEAGPADLRPLLQENFRAYGAYLRGDAPRPLTRLIDSRPFVELNDLVYVAAGTITDAGKSGAAERRQVPESGAELFVLPDIRKVVTAFAASGQFPSAQGVSWGRPGGSGAARADLGRLRETVYSLSP